MPTLIRLLMVIATIAVTACAPTSVQQSHITIRQPETLMEVQDGEEFEVIPGDSLKILETESCAEAKGICWKVISNKGKIAIVNAELMQDRQEVYIEKKGRTFTNGNFQSKHPKFTMNISPEFKYAGFVSERKDVMSVGGSRELYLITDSYLFVKSFNLKKTSLKTQNLPYKTDENWVKSTISVGFRKIETFYAGQLFRKVKKKLYAGVEQHAGKNYQYYIRKVYPGMKSAKTRYLYEKGGYVLPKCVLAKEIGRVVGTGQDMLISILYFEDIIDHGLSCSAFPLNASYLNEEEINFIEEFNGRSKFAYEIILSQ